MTANLELVPIEPLSMPELIPFHRYGQLEGLVASAACGIANIYLGTAVESTPDSAEIEEISMFYFN